jgi:hypothetical protein
MKDRCLNRKSCHFAYYGGRGITVDPAWMTFSNFLADMGPKPTPKHSIERLDNAKGYGPGNCVWATHTDQMRNRRNVKLSMVKANQIRAMHRAKVGGYKVLARLFGVDRTQIRGVVRNELWRPES